MILTFPHMGNTYISAKAFFDDMGINYIIPPFNNKLALELGTKYAPETVCLPFKINIGNYIQAHKMGADTVFVTGGSGPCRFGYFGELQRQILKDIGIDMDVIVLESPNQGFMEFIRKLKIWTGGLNLYKIGKSLKSTAYISKRVDRLENLTFQLRPREILKGSVDKVYSNFLQDVKSCSGSGEIIKFISETEGKLLRLNINPDIRPLKVGIVGEIYCTIDSTTNLYINSKLGNLGVEVSRPVTISSWVIDHMIKPTFHIPTEFRSVKESYGYLDAMIGGHAQETVGNAVIFAREGFDGIIQIYPLTCMPEIVSASILPTISNQFDIPILTLIIDEMTAEPGYVTRLEAFVDLLNQRKESRQSDKTSALSWS